MTTGHRLAAKKCIESPWDPIHEGS
jgi:hypothetical protein